MVILFRSWETYYGRQTFIVLIIIGSKIYVNIINIYILSNDDEDYIIIIVIIVIFRLYNVIHYIVGKASICSLESPWHHVGCQGTGHFPFSSPRDDPEKNTMMTMFLKTTGHHDKSKQNN